ncbi:hypothetical protein J6590_003152 [Homalodisca vitripennis]|nr:hypothetical protein J6590_003152 [Homalodisca vitripennis]
MRNQATYSSSSVVRSSAVLRHTCLPYSWHCMRQWEYWVDSFRNRSGATRSVNFSSVTGIIHGGARRGGVMRHRSLLVWRGAASQTRQVKDTRIAPSFTDTFVPVRQRARWVRPALSCAAGDPLLGLVVAIMPEDGGAGDADPLETTPDRAIDVSSSDADHGAVRGCDVVLPTQEVEGTQGPSVRVQPVSPEARLRNTVPTVYIISTIVPGPCVNVVMNEWLIIACRLICA